MALDTQASPTLVERPRISRTLWATTGVEADASAGVEVKATPGASLALHITHVIITSDDADAHPYLEDEDNTLLFGPFVSTVEGVVVDHHFEHPIKLTDNKALHLNAAAAGNVTLYIEGFTA